MTLHSLGSHHPPKQVPDTQLQYNCFHGSVYLKYFITEKSAAWKIESSREKNLSAIQLWLFDLHSEVNITNMNCLNYFYAELVPEIYIYS